MQNNDFRTTTSALLRRANLYLEDKNWSFASDYYENVLDIDPENAHAYVGLLMVSLKITKESDLEKSLEAFDQHKHFLKAIRFADDEYKVLLQKYCNDNIYFRAQEILKCAKTAADFRDAQELLSKISDQIEVKELLDKCEVEEERLHRKERYEEAQKLMNSALISDLNTAIQLFKEDASEESARNIETCKNRIVAIEEEIEKKQRKKKITIVSILGIVVLSVILILSAITSSNNKKAEEIYNNFLGQSFSSSIEADDGFSRDFLNGNLSPFKIYWETTEERTLRFNENGTVYYTSLLDKTVLVYPKSISEPDRYHREDDDTYDFFSVSVSLDGTVYVKIGGYTCEVRVDSNNVPQSIYDYKGITLNLK